MNSKYETVIGLEVHVCLKTSTKLFCRCSNRPLSQQNTNICPVCTGQPGVLPVINRKAVEQAVRAGLALNCNIKEKSVFARKQYFYPDLPKNYQISQYELPIAEGGYVDLKDGERIELTRAHMEEDAGKLIHSADDVSLVDYNRTGTPLLEIVSEPVIKSPSQAAEYLKTLRQILRYTDVSDCDMEKGTMRADANISLRPAGSDKLGTKTELKNMNSFKAVEKALEYEVSRQNKVLTKGEELIQETRLWNEETGKTMSMRSKEEAHDYRYFPEPDLPVLNVSNKFVESIRTDIPEMPIARAERYIKEYGLSEYDALVVTSEKEIADYFDKVVENINSKKPEIIKKISNWLTVELMGKTNSEGVEFAGQPVSAKHLADLIILIDTGEVSGKMAKDIFSEMWVEGSPPADIVKKKGLKQISSDDQISGFCQNAIDSNPDIVEKYLSGKEGVLGALVGSVMKESKGQANPKMVSDKLKELLLKIK